MDIGKVLSGLYASEIDCSVDVTPGNSYAFEWWVGDEDAEHGRRTGATRTVDEAAQAMHAAALRLFPNSEYAKKATAKSEETQALIPRIKAVRSQTGCGLNEALEACRANATVEGAIHAIRRNAAKLGIPDLRTYTSSARELTPEMVQAVGEALEKFTTYDEGGWFYPASTMLQAAAKLRAAFGIEEG